MYEDDSSFQHPSKAKLVCGQGEIQTNMSPDSNHWDFYEFPGHPYHQYDESFNDLQMSGNYYLPPFASHEDESYLEQ